MVKGISKQVIVVNSPDEKLFDQAIFILSDEALNSGGYTDALLLKEAKRFLNHPVYRKRNGLKYCVIYTLAGAFITGFAWMLSAIL